MNDPNSAPAADPALNPNPAAPPAAVVPPAAPPNSDTAVPPPQDPSKAAGPTFASTWRADIASGDDKALKALERFATPQDLAKSYFEAQARIRSGELAKPLPKDATPEQIKEYREGNGIPEKPEGYFEKLPNGLVIGEDDKPLFDGFAKALHELNAPPTMVHKAVEWYYGMQDQQIQAQQEADAQAKPALENALREAWGADFKANANVYASYIAAAPKEVQDTLKSARDAEGNFILYKPEVVSWLVAQAREINPAAHITPAGNEGTVQSIQAEIDGIEKFMRTNRTEYNRDNAKQERLRQLYDARVKLQKRGQAA